MIWFFAAAFAEEPAQPSASLTPVPNDQLTNAFIALITAAATVATQKGWAAGRRRWGGDRGVDHERRLTVLEEAKHYHGNCITGLAGHTNYDLPPRQPVLPDLPSGGSSEGS